MTRKKTKLLLIALFLVLLSMMTMTSAAPPDSSSPIITRGVPVPGSGNYFDSLGTTTYEDAGNTTAAGWGSGDILNPRASGLVSYLDGWAYDDEVYSVELQGRKLYVTLFDPTYTANTLRVYNISDPTDLILLGTRGSATHLMTGEIDGDIMAVGKAGTGWMALYNVSDPTSIPTPIDSDGTFDGNVTDIEFQGRHMFVSSYKDSGDDLCIYDVEDPSNIIKTYGSAWSELLGLAVQGDILYLADGAFGLYLQNITDPYGLTSLDSYNTLGNATDVIVDGDFAYVADGTSGVQVLDCSDPTNVVKVDGFNTPGTAVDLALHGDTLFVADGWSGVRIFDVSDPTSIRWVGQINTVFCRDVDVQGGILAIAAGNYVYLYSIGELTSPILYSTYSDYDALDVEVQGDIAYVAAGADGLVVLDVSDRVNPTLLDNYDPGTCFYTSVDVEGIHCYITNDDSPNVGVHVFDVTDPTNVVHIGFDAWGRGLDIYMHGDMGYFADGHAGFFTLNMSDPWSPGPNHDSEITALDNCTSTFAQGSFAYAGGQSLGSPVNKGIFIFDISDVDNLVITDNVSLSEVEDVFVSGDFMAVADGAFGVYIFNISDPFDIQLLDFNNLGTGGYTTSVYIHGNYIIAADRGKGIFIVNATDPDDITLVSSYVTGSPECLSIDCDGDFAYVACRDKLMIFRIFNSRADTWDTTTRYAQSLEVDTTERTIENATLTYAIGIDFGDSGATVSWQLSADGGYNWESVVGGSPHTFTNQGNKLLWRATLSTSYNDRTPYISWVEIDYEYNDLPTTPVLTDPGTTDTDGDLTVSWSTCTDDSAVAYYHIQMSDEATFTTSTNWWETTTSKAFTGLTNDTYYFRVRAQDDDGEYGDWSSTESITVAIPPITTTPPPPPPPPIPGFPIEALILGIGSALGMLLVLRRRNLRKH